MIVRKRKVVLYALKGAELLVFSEPDFPEVGIQVPGGTIECGEDVVTGAKREWLEETGRHAERQFRYLETYTYRFDREGCVHEHERHVFVVDAADISDLTWDAFETTPDSGGESIRLRFFWLPLGEARDRLEFGFSEKVDRVREFVEARA